MSGTAETRIENAVADLNRQIAQAPLPEAPVRAPMRWGRALAAGSAITIMPSTSFSQTSNAPPVSMRLNGLPVFNDSFKFAMPSHRARAT